MNIAKLGHTPCFEKPIPFTMSLIPIIFAVVKQLRWLLKISNFQVSDIDLFNPLSPYSHFWPNNFTYIYIYTYPGVVCGGYKITPKFLLMFCSFPPSVVALSRGFSGGSAGTLWPWRIDPWVWCCPLARPGFCGGSEWWLVLSRLGVDNKTKGTSTILSTIGS